ncbi:hypothetical protein IID19_02745 [Patescibacteria group bacterium]|nr:hypothetical protein [Patescibacteria group bacterium]
MLVHEEPRFDKIKSFLNMFKDKEKFAVWVTKEAKDTTFVDCDIATLASGQSQVLTLVFAVTDNNLFCGQQIFNIAKVSSDEEDLVLVNNISSTILTTIECAPIFR